MNVNIVLTCATCSSDTDCRIGFSNRDVQPITFACPHCGNRIDITLDTSDAPGYSLAYVNATPSQNQYRPFDGRNPFVDLHLDFPVAFRPYVMGMTPFMAAMQQVEDAAGDGNGALQLITFHSQRLDQLNFFASKADDVRRVIRLYFGTNKQLFKTRAGQIVGEDFGPSLEPEAVNYALYAFVRLMFAPFVHVEEVAVFNQALADMVVDMSTDNPKAFEQFADHLKETKLLIHLQRDCLNIYPEIYEAELALRPAMFLDLLGSDSSDQRIAGRVSSKDFGAYKDLYKDLCELLGRQLILVAAINNIVLRGGHDNFAPTKDGPALTSLDKFANKTLSEKFKYLDDCWFDLDTGVVSTGIRNAIAHHLAHYDDVRQLITYFPEKEGVRQEKSETMTFLAFMRLVLQLFREVHYLHILVRTLLTYENERQRGREK